MKKKFAILVIIGFFISNIVFAQTEVEKPSKKEYFYFTGRITLNNSLCLAAADDPQLFLNTPYGHMKISPAGAINYNFGTNAGIIFNIDTKSELWGLGIGVEYLNNACTYKFFTPDTSQLIGKISQFNVKQVFRNQGVGVPLYFKIWPNFYQKQQYLFLGSQINFNIMTTLSEKVSFGTGDLYRTHLPKSAIRSFNFLFFLGFNYYIYNIQFDYMPKGFVNNEYVDENGSTKFSNLPNSYINIRLGISLPINRWLTSRNWTAEKVRRVITGRNK